MARRSVSHPCCRFQRGGGRRLRPPEADERRRRRPRRTQVLLAHATRARSATAPLRTHARSAAVSPAMQRVFREDRRLNQRAGAGSVLRQLRRPIFDAVAEKGLEGSCDGRVPASPAARRDALVDGVAEERVPELIPVFAARRQRSRSRVSSVRRRAPAEGFLHARPAARRGAEGNRTRVRSRHRRQAIAWRTPAAG